MRDAFKGHYSLLVLINVSVLPGSLFHLQMSCIQSWRPKAEGWTQSPCWGPRQYSSETRRTHLNQTCFPEYFLINSISNSELKTDWGELYSRWTHSVLGGGDGAGCPGLPPEVGSTVLVRHELQHHWLRRVQHKQCQTHEKLPARRSWTPPDSPETLWSTPGGCVLCTWASGRPTRRRSRPWTPAAAVPGPRWSALAWKHPCYWPTRPPSESPEDGGRKQISITTQYSLQSWVTVSYLSSTTQTGFLVEAGCDFKPKKRSFELILSLT